MIKAEELQAVLRCYEPLKTATIVYESQTKRLIARNICKLSGFITINGQPQLYEADLNLLNFNSFADIERLVNMLMASFAEAEKNIG